ncbi:hypothetical protein GOV12_06235 [Candidatus Pacearchaeota archaeon]|nr:hypothetical protein [Candidatus Pacearchaeota archaeon]
MENPNPTRLVLSQTLHNYARTRNLPEEHTVIKTLEWLKKDESALMKYNHPDETRVTEIIDAFQNYMAEEYELDWTILPKDHAKEKHRYIQRSIRCIRATLDLSRLVTAS